MRRFTSLILRATAVAAAVTLGLGVACQKPRNVTTTRQPLEAPAMHACEQVVLTGLVRDPRVRTPPEGNSYASFTVIDGTGRVGIIAWGTQEVAANDLVEVRGVFHDRIVVGGESMHDVVEAKFVRVLRRAPQPPGTPVGPP